MSEAPQQSRDGGCYPPAPHGQGTAAQRTRDVRSFMAKPGWRLRPSCPTRPGRDRSTDEVCPELRGKAEAEAVILLARTMMARPLNGRGMSGVAQRTRDVRSFAVEPGRGSDPPALHGQGAAAQWTRDVRSSTAKPRRRLLSSWPKRRWRGHSTDEGCLELRGKARAEAVILLAHTAMAWPLNGRGMSKALRQSQGEAVILLAHTAMARPLNG
ncbi:hypothetical protein ABZP36_036055 [Zizania latifolia]